MTECALIKVTFLIIILSLLATTYSFDKVVEYYSGEKRIHIIIINTFQ